MVVLPRNKKFFSRLHWARLGVRKLDESEAEQLTVNLLLAALTDKQSLTTRLDKAQILLEADEFVTRYNLHDSRDSIRKGALLAYDPHDYARIDGLTDAEITALQNDKVYSSQSLYRHSHRVVA
ncbi:hypothetical protein AnigIFM59636_006302 [Aspergillus niger]|uniref:Uncharacterized protein n=2 Tax=Aspergillus niger TaxID=5061 RepID=A2QWG5_ASPNC|nr:hypothetical protein An11g05070 [Aspergillus niger]GJP96023.1 hypothetical protein AlacWU_08922 [Aspergillus niger]GKZ93233.1 hypothetical protein AnigIFM59636_006302 [Aspergillus niger]CAK48406.1 hypothetical protein An11g05070 [Aspergillus niger]